MSVFMNFYDPKDVRRPVKIGGDTIKNAAIDYLDELKQMKIWICWNFVEARVPFSGEGTSAANDTGKQSTLNKTKTRASGKPTKVPIAASGEITGTDEGHSHTWVTFDEAKAAAAEKQYSGVGFVIPVGWFFLDIDHRPLDDPYVIEMLERFGSYAEKSVSGEGIHIYGKCDFSIIPTERTEKGRVKLSREYYQKNPNNGTELYIGGLTNRYAVFTGNMIHNKPLHDCTEAILLTLEKDMKKSLPPTGAPQGEGLDIIASLRNQKNGAKFSRLYDVGDFSDYGSQSEADLALCTMIAYRTGPDPEAIDKIFRGSALYREKWERDDYRTETIRKAIELIPPGQSYPERGSKTYEQDEVAKRELGAASRCPEFIRFKDKTGEPYVVVPLLAQHVRDHLQYLLVRDSGKQGLLKYVYEGGVYKLYADEMFKGCVKQFIEDYDPELVKIKQVNEAFQHIITDRNYISQDELNSREDIINFKNGLLVVTAGELRLIPHDPAVYSTIQIPCNWTGERSDTPVFADYLKTLTDGDKAVAKLLLQFMGVCLSNVKGWRMKKALFLVGDGDTGKSQLKSLVERLLGRGNFIGADLDTIEARFGTGTIYGTRLAGSSDMGFMTVKELKTFKMLTGGDSVFAEFKGMQGFEFTYSGLLWFCMNRLPKFGGDNGSWVYNRIMVVNCPNVIPPEKQDKQLLDKMYNECEGIVYLAVRALQKVLLNGFRYDEPESVSQAREQYMAENNTVICFFDECMTQRPDGKIRDNATTGKVYKVYREWCIDNNSGFAKTAKEFRDTLASHLGSTFEEMTKRSGGNTYYKDYTLTYETKTQYARVYGYDGTHNVDDE